MLTRRGFLRIAGLAGLLFGLSAHQALAWSLVDSTSLQSTGSATTTSRNTTGAQVVVLGITDNGTGTAPTDSKSNTWTSVGTPAGGESNLATRLWYCALPCTVGTGHTFTFNGGFGTLIMEAWSGASGTPIDQKSAVQTTGSTANVNTTSVTPSVSNELIIAYYGTGNPDGTACTDTINQSFTIDIQKETVGGAEWGGTMAHLAQGAAAAVSPTLVRCVTTSSGYSEGLLLTLEPSAVTATPVRALMGVGQ